MRISKRLGSVFVYVLAAMYASTTPVQADGNRAPDVSAATPSISSIWPPNNKMVPVTIIGVTDPDGDAVTITITSITNNETGSEDADGVGTSTAQVRASRDGSGSGRVYTITFTADDGHGGSASGLVQVFVPKDQGGRLL